MDRNLLIIVGNATVDKRFLNELFKNPLGTVERYGFQLTPSEQEGLRELTKGKHSTDNKNHLKAVYVCPKRPCVGLALPQPYDAPPVTKEPPKVA
jgi:hypothetical protein